MTPQDRKMRPTWAKLEKNITISTMGTFFAARRSRLRDIAWINKLQKTIRLRWGSLKNGIAKRAEKLEGNQKPRMNHRLAQKAKARLQLGQRLERKESMQGEWKKTKGSKVSYRHVPNGATSLVGEPGTSK